MTEAAAVQAGTVPRRRLDARVRAARGTLLVAGAGEALELDEVAAFMWKQIDGTRTVAEIADAVAGAYDVDAGTARDDVAELLGELVEVGVVELGGATG